MRDVNHSGDVQLCEGTVDVVRDMAGGHRSACDDHRLGEDVAIVLNASRGGPSVFRDTLLIRMALFLHIDTSYHSYLSNAPSPDHDA